MGKSGAKRYGQRLKRTPEIKLFQPLGGNLRKRRQGKKESKKKCLEGNETILLQSSHLRRSNLKRALCLGRGSLVLKVKREVHSDGKNQKNTLKIENKNRRIRSSKCSCGLIPFLSSVMNLHHFPTRSSKGGSYSSLNLLFKAGYFLRNHQRSR